MLLLSGAARYMTSAGGVPMQLYSHRSLVTSIAHFLYNCAKKVCKSFSAADALIAAARPPLSGIRMGRSSLLKSVILPTLLRRVGQHG